MPDIETRRAVEHDRQGIARIIVDCFKEDFIGVTDDFNKLAMAVERIVQADRFFVGVMDAEVVGIMACSDEKGRAMSIHRPEGLRHMDAMRGKLFPGHGNYDSAYIEFVAVNERVRRSGIATGMLDCAIRSTGYDEYLLYVYASNVAAKNCYSRFGFVEVGRAPDVKKPEKGERIYMAYMKR